MFEICIEIPATKFHIKSDGRICVLTGESGIGKSSLVSYLRGTFSSNIKRSLSIDGINIERMSTRDIVILDDDSLLEESDEFILFNYYSRQVVFVIDDIDVELSGIVGRLYRLLPDSQFMLITRNESIPGLNYSVNNVYRMYYDTVTGLHHIERCIDTVDYKKIGDVSFINNTLVVSEDSKEGFQFYSNIFKSNVKYITNSRDDISGKDELCNMLDMVLGNYKRVILMIDWCSFGFNLPDLARICKKYSYVEFVFNTDLLCFEWVLLNSNIIKRIQEDKKDQNILVDKRLFVEKQCQQLLVDITHGTELYLTHHSNLPICYKAPCCAKKHLSEGCKYYMAGNKLEVMFRRTKFEYIINCRGL